MEVASQLNIKIKHMSKKIKTIQTIDGLNIPITQVMAIYIETTEVLGQVAFYALVGEGDNTAFKYFNPKTLSYPKYRNVDLLGMKVNDYLLKVVEYDYKKVFSQEEIEKAFESNYFANIDEWTIKQATPRVLAFNKKIYDNLEYTAQVITL
jgi:hypothetical protein